MGFIQNAQYKKMAIILSQKITSLDFKVEKPGSVFENVVDAKKVLSVQIAPSVVAVFWVEYYPEIRTYCWYFAVADLSENKDQFGVFQKKVCFSTDGSGLPVKDCIHLLLNFYDALDPEHSMSTELAFFGEEVYLSPPDKLLMSATSYFHSSTKRHYTKHPPASDLIEFAKYQQNKCTGAMIF